MHKEILTKKQKEFFPDLSLFSPDFGLVGGTAIALHLGHRQSVDFGLFSNKEFDNLAIKKKIKKRIKVEKVLVDQSDEFSFISDGVKFTFFYYPFQIDFSQKIDDLKLPDLLTLVAMKAYSLGRRAKWKDYIDLYFIMKDHFNIKKIIEKTKNVFGNEFNEKIFRTQLSYFKDINYSEKIVYLAGFEKEEKEIKKELTNFSLDYS